MARLVGGVVDTIFAAADRRLVAGILVAAGFILVAIFLIASGMSSKRRRMEVPHALRPGPSDEELEQKTLPRFLAVGAIFLLFMAIYLPAYWLREPTRIRLKEEQFARQSISRGKVIYEPAEPGSPHFSANCARCHGPAGEGSVQPFKEVFRVAEPPLKLLVSRYKAAGKNDDEIKLLVRDAIERGRPGTLMPTWGLAFGGPLNSEQVDDVLNFIYSIQEDFPKADPKASGASLFAANCSTCHGVNASGGAAPDLRTVLSQYYDEDLFDIIRYGKLNTNRVSMPSWAALGDAAIRSLVDFLRTLQTGEIKGKRPTPTPSPSPAAGGRSPSPAPTGGN